MTTSTTQSPAYHIATGAWHRIVWGAVLLAAAAPALAGPPIVLDGSFDEWRDVNVAATDAPDDAAPGAPVDLHTVRIADDPQFVHLLIDFGRTMNIQKMHGRVELAINADGDRRTGRRVHRLPGVDIVLTLTAPHPFDAQREPMGIGLRSTTYDPLPPDPQTGASPRPPLSPYDVGFTFAPTYANDTVEMRLQRGVELPDTPRLFSSGAFSLRLVAFNDAGRIVDETPVVRHDFATSPDADEDAAEASRISAQALAAAPDADLRLVSWNAEYGAVMMRTQPFARTLRALQPDVILWQELSDKHDATHLAGVLNAAMPDPDRPAWTVLYGAGGGPLRCGIASRLPVQPVDALDLIPYPDRPDRSLRIAGAIVQVGDRDLLLVSIHLRCCGSAGSREDRTRLEEVELIRDAIHRVLLTRRVDGLVIAGDFNLVGSRTPLDTLIAGLDLDGTDLAVVPAMQLDGRSNATWADHDQPFVPGRLDFMVLSDAGVEPLKAFVYDARDLDVAARAQLAITADDTRDASDHLPLVVDVKVNPMAR